MLKIAVITGMLGISLSVNATTSASAMSEFKRALTIITKSQLTLFRTEPADTTSEIIDKLQQRLSVLDTPTDTDDTELTVMRSILTETLDSFNDQYANYITPKQLAGYQERRNGNYVGVGLKFRAVADDYPIVIGTILGGPLSDKSVLPGDRLLTADGKDLKHKTSKEITTLLKGPAASQVTLGFRRQDAPAYNVTVHRQPVDLYYARSQVIDKHIGYIKISRFGARTHKHVEALLQGLVQQKVSGIVLDLRDNPGGSTRASRAIVSMFSDADTIYCERYQSGNIRNIPRHGQHLTDLPIAVLVNGDSMSSAEIVAGALQAHNRAIIIGSPTYGKGLVQKVTNLKEPLGGAVRTTIAMFATPDHQPIHGAGIVPDIYLETEADFLFRETGSLNISEQARGLQRKLREKSALISHPDNAAELINATDLQLARAVSELSRLGDIAASRE